MLSEASRRSIRCLIITLLGASVIVTPMNARAEHSGEAAERAAREILDARDRANAAAQAMFDAESRLDGLTIELAAAEGDLLVFEAEVSELRASLAESAVRQYTGAGTRPLMLFQDIGVGTDQSAARVYAGAATGSELVQADDYDEAIRELDEARQALEQQRNDTVEARETWTALKATAENEVLELQQIEQERLADAEVQHELERQRQERAEQARLEREESERQAAADAAAAEAAAAAARTNTPSDSDSGSTRPGDAPSNDSTSETPNPPPAPVPPPTPVAPPPPAPNAGAGMACPVAGPRSFADTWGAPRSGGRSHEGVDMMAPGGTPLVAAEAGSATFKTNRLGGNAVWITGASGTKYYYAHLSAWEGSSRTVSRGETIGYVGATGNTSVNHLHFEVHPNGGRAVNPYPYVRAVC